MNKIPVIHGKNRNDGIIHDLLFHNNTHGYRSVAKRALYLVYFAIVLSIVAIVMSVIVYIRQDNDREERNKARRMNGYVMV